MLNGFFLSLQDNADPSEDPFAKASEAKRERVAKNELQRLRNIARTKKVRLINQRGANMQKKCHDKVQT